LRPKIETVKAVAVTRQAGFFTRRKRFHSAPPSLVAPDPPSPFDILTQITPRIFSPSMLTIASVSVSMISFGRYRRRSRSDEPSISGMVVFPFGFERWAAEPIRFQR
jgi:hypothetical protein